MFLANMEQLLWLYNLPYDEGYPVVYFDEWTCFLIGDELEPLSMQSGRVAKQHNTYVKNGSCVLLAAIEPLTGKQHAVGYERRTKNEDALFLKSLAACFSNAIKIRLVQDNLSTHNASSFYEHMPAVEAFELAKRFKFYYTPKSASGLNIIEIEFSALVKQCLDRRIATQQKLSEEIKAIIKERNDKRISIN